VNGQDDLSQSPLYTWLVEKAQKGYNAQPWGALIGLYSFAANAGTLRFSAGSRKSPAMLGAVLSGARFAGMGEMYKPARMTLPPGSRFARARRRHAWIRRARFLVRPPYGVGAKPVEKSLTRNISPAQMRPISSSEPRPLLRSAFGQIFHQENWQFKPGSELEFDQCPCT